MRKLPLKQVICVTAATVLMSGCSTVVQQIQETTGNEIRKVEESKASAPTEIKSKQVMKEIDASPGPHTKIEDILQDPGKGSFSGNKFNPSKVYQALDQMPIGLERDAAFQYLLGLLGENYKQLVTVYDDVEMVDLKEQARVLSEIAKDHQAKPPTAEEQAAIHAGAVKNNQILFLVDASSSMGKDIQGKSKMEWIKGALTQVTKTIPKGTQIHVRMFGKEGGVNDKDPGQSCKDTSLLYSGVEWTVPVWSKSMNQLESKEGWNPAGLAIQEGTKDLSAHKEKSRENRVVLITDGVDKCNTNPVQQAKQLSDSDLHAAINVISFGSKLQEEKQGSSIASQSGGEFISIKDGEKLTQALQSVTKEIRQMDTPWQVRALEKSAKTLQNTREQLKDGHQSVSETTKNEQEHLQAANEYIFNQSKIEKTDYERIGQWIDQRYEQVDGHIKKQYQKSDKKLRKDWLTQVDNLEKSWDKTNPKNTPNTFAEKKTEILGDAK
ncbi:von Willebrand factor type A domain-containing protein [Thermoactinomyces sp. DSM 45891]|uniref:vWA domain-containing protein n=1 Tax=Thermoactinomyces sp. DSM 45891 TaxID=1761907 RepID=UPI00091EC342|nr:VWA domain-containing protein [Thermoactinomyces sp. DSM 45891]SFX72990.1 von Willebrand factor type A domain-containing protein [Thermoactinomyces sp. DSM 45891]